LMIGTQMFVLNRSSSSVLHNGMQINWCKNLATTRFRVHHFASNLLKISKYWGTLTFTWSTGYSKKYNFKQKSSSDPPKKKTWITRGQSEFFVWSVYFFPTSYITLCNWDK
jgi:hypothetical protein